MKNAIILFLLFAITGLVSGQNVIKDKPKQVIQKDSIKKDKEIAQPSVVFNDTVISLKGVLKLYKKEAHASYYANKFNGKRTASGKKFDNTKYTAAHRKLPFGTILKITNEANGKSVLVEVIDRGPFSRGREIDITRKAFMEISSNKNSGVAIVKIETLE